MLFLLNSNSLSAQCYNCINQNPAAIQSITPNTGFQTISSSMQGGTYAMCYVETGVTYTWSTCNGSNNTFDTKLTLLSAYGCSSSNKLAYNDNYSGCGNKSKIIWTATFTGLVKILLSENLSNAPCTSTNKTLLLEWEATTKNCFHPLFLCNGQSFVSGLINVPEIPPHSSTQYGSNSAILKNNQTWYHFQIAQAGIIKIDIASPTNLDIDGVIWGSFTDLSNPCLATTTIYKTANFSMLSNFQLTINPTIADVGKYFLIMISSYNLSTSTAATISFTNTTAGKIALCPPTLTYNQPLCESGDLQLNALPTVSGATYYWTGPNGFTSNLQNPFINNISTVSSGAYTCYYTTNYGISTSSSINLTVNPKPLTSNIYHN